MTRQIRVGGACTVTPNENGFLDLSMVASGAKTLSPMLILGISDGMIGEKIDFRYDNGTRSAYPNDKFDSYLVYFSAAYQMSDEAIEGFMSLMSTYWYPGDDWTVIEH